MALDIKSHAVTIHGLIQYFELFAINGDLVYSSRCFVRDIIQRSHASIKSLPNRVDFKWFLGIEWNPISCKG